MDCHSFSNNHGYYYSTHGTPQHQNTRVFTLKYVFYMDNDKFSCSSLHVLTYQKVSFTNNEVRVVFAMLTEFERNDSK